MMQQILVYLLHWAKRKQKGHNQLNKASNLVTPVKYRNTGNLQLAKLNRRTESRHPVLNI